MRKASSKLREILSQNIKDFRVAKGLSQEKLAELSCLHRTYVGSVERAERNVTLSSLESLAVALGVSVPELLTPKEHHAYREGSIFCREYPKKQ